jgi:hypothetical protein
MKRTVRYVLPAAMVVLVCLVGLSTAQQGPTAAAPGKEQEKAGAVENASDIAAKRQARMDKDREEVFAKWNRQLDELKNQKAKLQSNQKELRGEIYKRCGMSPENVVPSLLNIEKEIFTAQIDLRVKARGNQIIDNQISKTTEESKIILDNDQILKELKMLVNDKTDACKILEGMQKSGTAPYIELNKAKNELSEAKIRLAIREEDLTKGNGNAGTAKLNILMRENSLEEAQLQIRINVLSDKCQILRDNRDMVDNYNDITESEIPRLNRLIDRLSEKILELKEW